MERKKKKGYALLSHHKLNMNESIQFLLFVAFVVVVLFVFMILDFVVVLLFI